MSTPLGDEDVEPVKHLMALGFSRTQAVDALDRNGYDVLNALNNLLGAPPTVPSATQHLTPPIEEPPRLLMSTPLGDEDAEPVKHLTALGFSRTQAVDALDRNGYDVQKALNNLLGAP